ncbi:Type III restriction enzyme, res subunit [Bacteroidales bacterium Barb6]|nr:Type III restriction enzyme, res subunit [Bacteroidales bacterium Barb6]
MTLRNYQETISDSAAESLHTCGMAYLAMEVRTGKTFTALAAAGKYGAKNVLFVTKKNALPSIEADYGTLSPAYALKAVNFESLHKVTGTYDLIIIDEAHSVGVAFPKPSKKAQELKRICQGLSVMYLSGTPSPESYSQMYHQLWVSSHSPWAAFPNFYKWVNAGYVTKQTRVINGFSINDYSKLERTPILS